MRTENDFPALLQAFFTDRLCHQRQASPHTIASYRDTFRLLLGFAERRLKKAPSALRSRISIPRSSARSSIIWSKNAAMPPAAAMCASRHSIRFSATWPSTSQR